MKMIGERIRDRRIELGMSQDELAKRLHYKSRSTINKIEAGVNDISQSKVRAFSQALDITEADLLGIKLFPGPADAGTEGSKKVPSVSDGALQVAKDYDALDSHGRRIVRDVIVAEQDRMAEEAKIIEFDPEKKKRECTVFLEPSAAGKAAPTFGEDFDIVEVPDDAPQGIEFGVRVKGDSMQPYYKDGQTVYVNHDPLKDGEVGIFCVDGGTVIKQYHYDKVLGITYLFSLNRKRADCDVVITPNSDRQLVFQGRVLGTHVFPLPGADE